MKLEMAFGWLLVVALSCGGKTVGDDSPAHPAAWPRLINQRRPAPSFAIGWSRSARAHRMQPAKAIASLRTPGTPSAPASSTDFLKCMGTTHVECTPGEVVIIDCSDERVSLQHCGQ